MFNTKGRFIWQREVHTSHSCSQSVLDGDTDCSGSIPVSILLEHFPKFKENAFFSFKNMKLRHFSDLIVSTQRYTVKQMKSIHLIPKVK